MAPHEVPNDPRGFYFRMNDHNLPWSRRRVLCSFARYLPHKKSRSSQLLHPRDNYYTPGRVIRSYGNNTDPMGGGLMTDYSLEYSVMTNPPGHDLRPGRVASSLLHPDRW